VQYQLSREKPLDAKFCHCKTCQVIHGSFPCPTSFFGFELVIKWRF
jgi:hypothetical protein